MSGLVLKRGLVGGEDDTRFMLVSLLVESLKGNVLRMTFIELAVRDENPFDPLADLY